MLPFFDFSEFEFGSVLTISYRIELKLHDALDVTYVYDTSGFKCSPGRIGRALFWRSAITLNMFPGI